MYTTTAKKVSLSRSKVQIHVKYAMTKIKTHNQYENPNRKSNTLKIQFAQVERKISIASPCMDHLDRSVQAKSSVQSSNNTSMILERLFPFNDLSKHCGGSLKAFEYNRNHAGRQLNQFLLEKQPFFDAPQVPGIDARST